MALGPLTNIAVAIVLDPDFVNNVERLYVMGASVPQLTNTPPFNEFNFSQDPPSNYIVFTSMRGHPIVLVPWETCIAPEISRVKYNNIFR